MTQQPPADAADAFSDDLFFWPRLPARFRVTVEDAAREYLRAKLKHGEYTLDGAQIGDGSRLSALVEEVGEVGRALTYDHPDSDLRAELIQVANVALTWASILPRRAD